MMNEQRYITQAGAEKLQKELAELTGPARQEIARRLRDAISMGDLSENADYHKAKEDQGFLEGRIQELDYLLKNAIVVEGYNGKRSIADIGASVTVQEDGEDPEVFHLVGAKEADPGTGKISNESPIGKALIGKKAGDSVSINTPGGTISLRILAIE